MISIKQQRDNPILLLFFCLPFFIFFMGCKKSSDDAGAIALTTTVATNIGPNSASSGGVITSGASASITLRGVCWSTHITPTMQDNSTNDGKGGGTFISTLTGLVTNKVYYIRAYAVNSSSTYYGDQLTIYGLAGPVTDVDGNVYYTIRYGNQYWTDVNLNTGKYNDGTDIPTGLSNADWGTTITGAYTIQPSDLSESKLYNYAAVATGKLCPSGWHIPSGIEWDNLAGSLGGANIAGDKMKLTSYWQTPNGATNSSGFNGYPAGYRAYDGSYISFSQVGIFWTSDGLTTTRNFRELYYDDPALLPNTDIQADPKSGYSCRCVADQ